MQVRVRWNNSATAQGSAVGTAAPRPPAVRWCVLEGPEGCDHSAWARWRDEWQLATRIWRKRHSEPARERKITSQYGQDVAVHVLRSRRAVSDFLDGLDADRANVDDG